MLLIDERIHEGYERRATGNGWVEKRGTYFDFRLGQDLEGGGKACEKIAEVVMTDEGVTGSSSVHRVYSLALFGFRVRGGVGLRRTSSVFV